MITVFIPNSVKSISNDAFSRWFKLNDINIPNELTIIKKNTFYFCKSLLHIVIPEKIVHIEEFAFDRCEILEDIVILGNINIIELYAFIHCDKLTHIKYYGEMNPLAEKLNHRNGLQYVIVCNNYDFEFFGDLPVQHVSCKLIESRPFLHINHVHGLLDIFFSNIVISKLDFSIFFVIIHF